MPLQATSGAASYDGFGGGAAAVPQYIEEVFSTQVYTGSGTSKTITNNIDLSTKGGLVWTKLRASPNSNGPNHRLSDSAIGVNQVLSSNNTDPQTSSASFGISAFNVDGYTITNPGADGGWNYTNDTFVSWTFRKQPKFFDVVTFTAGTSTNQRISHSLGSVPGCIIIKCTSTTSGWYVYHRSLGRGQYTRLNVTSDAVSSTNIWGTSDPTSTDFGVNAPSLLEGSGTTYVAYLFAHNAGGFGLTGADNVVSCGSFTGSSGSVNLGYEPQWLLVKQTNSANSWRVFDNMRGWTVGPTKSTGNAILIANTSAAETDGAGYWGTPTATGFDFDTGGGDYIYIAIRRGPMKVPTSATSVFAPVIYTGDNSNTRVITTGFPPDMVWTGPLDPGGRRAGDRLRGLFTNPGPVNYTYAAGEESLSSYSLPQMSGWQTGNGTVRFENSAAVNYVLHAFKRAPGFFDIVCYTGTGGSLTLTHNLGVVPELAICKSRTNTDNWEVAVVNPSNPSQFYVGTNADRFGFNLTNGYGASPFITADYLTATTFKAGTWWDKGVSARTYVAYLFATCPGVSKVGSYTGTGTTLQVNCGFTAGARFVLIKRTDSTGDWYVWDTARGIVSGNDPYLLLNSSAAEVTNTDYVDTYNAGFEISSTAPSAINANGGTYIFLAIA
jgi:hypothetical protein